MSGAKQSSKSHRIGLTRRLRSLFFEPLEARNLLATIAGVVFDDLNANGQRDIAGQVSVPLLQLAPVGEIIMSPNDDLSTDAIDLGFTFEFYGRSFSTAYINNNGNITFQQPLSEFTSDGFPQLTPIVAPFWADVDTRAANSGSVHLVKGTSPRGNSYFQVDWVDVGYYNKRADKLNDFSLYLEDSPSGDIVAFFYRNMEWTTGSASDGTNGFGGTGAQMGFDSGNGTNFISLARPRSASELVPFINTSFRFRVNPEGTPDALGFETGIPGGTVFIDQNGNGELDATETSVTTSQDNPATALDEAGFFQFDGLALGNYTVRQVVPAGVLETTPTSGFIQVELSNDSEVDGGHEFGRFELGSIAGRVLDDANGNGQLDAGEEGVTGFAVYLDTNQNRVHDDGEPRTITDGSGGYTFGAIGFGRHHIRVERPAEWIQASPIADVHEVLVTSGVHATDMDFLLFRQAAINGLVYNDRNRSNSPDSGDESLEGWTIFVDANYNGMRDGAEPFDTTSGIGGYRIDELPPGPHRVRAVAPAGWEAVHPDDAIQTVGVTSGVETGNVDFGFAEVPAPRVTAAWPMPTDSVGVGVERIELTFDRALDRATLWVNSFSLMRSGGDGTFGDGNETVAQLLGVRWDGTANKVAVELEGFLPQETYQFVASDDLMDEFGNRLDGEWSGAFPTGNGEDGGAFVLNFVVTNAPPTAHPGRGNVLQTGSLPIVLEGSDAEGDSLTFRVADQPASGTLTAGDGTGEWTYTPSSTFAGQDRFTFAANDGTADSRVEEFLIAVASAPTDLEPLSLDVNAPAGLAMGREIELQWTARNSGPGTTVDHGRDWVDRLYLSQDDQLDAGDLLVGSWNGDVSPLASSGTYNATMNVMMPLEHEFSGDLFLILEVDARRDQLDTNFDNNLLLQPVEFDPAIELVAPYTGRFVDSLSPLTIAWRDIAQDASGAITLAIDSDSDPTNGTGHTVLATGLLEDPDEDADQTQVTLPPLSNGGYYLWAQMNVDGQQVFSSPLYVRMVDQAYADPESLSDAIGGGSYEVFGVELGRDGDEMLFRVRTDFDPTARGGDLYLNVGGSFHSNTGRLVGIAVNDRVTSSGAEVKAGDIYLGATFDGGTFVARHPTFIRSYEEHVDDQSTLSILSINDQDWLYELSGSFPFAAINADPTDPLEVAWAMYCGNDLGSTNTSDPQPDLVGDGFSVSSDAATINWGDEITIDYTIANVGGAAAGPSAVSFFLSVDGIIETTDVALRELVNVPGLAEGDYTDGQIQVTLQTEPPSGSHEECEFTVGMIVDVSEVVEEADETNNRNGGESLDLTTAAIGGSAASQGIDQWYATRGSDPMQVTWSVCIGVTGDYDLDIDFELGNEWDLSSGARVLVDDVETDTFGPLGGADLGTLTVGLHKIQIDAFMVPTEAIVEEVDWQLDGPGSHDLELNALFVADHAMFDGAFPVAEANQTLTAQGLVEYFAPILHFTSGERFTHPFDAQESWDIGRMARERSLIRGDRDQFLDLSSFADGPPPGASSQSLYAAVLPGATLESHRAHPNELAINYYFYYPRSEWCDHGGVNTHDGDWEGITLFLKYVDGKWTPDRVAIAQHVETLFTTGGVVVPWENLTPTDSPRKDIFVGLGGHASYPGPGTTSWPSPEHHRGDGHRFDRGSDVTVFLPRVGSAETGDDNWLLYPGNWGRLDISECTFLGFSPNDDGPPGPVFLDTAGGLGTRWLNPWAWAEVFTRAPTIDLLSPNSTLVAQGDNLTLTAEGVTSDQSRFVDSVAFFLESNGHGGLQTGPMGDQPVGTDSFSLLGWDIVLETDGLPAGPHTFYALARDRADRIVLPLNLPLNWGPYVRATVTIGVTPTANADLVSATEDVAVEIPWSDLFQNDTDEDSPPSRWQVASVDSATNGTVVSELETQTIRFTPEPDFFGTATFVYTLDDGDGLRDTGIVTIEIASVNDAPTAIVLDNLTVDEETAAVVGNLTVEDPDTDDTHTFALPSNLRLEITDAHQLRVRPGREFDFETQRSVPLILAATDAGGLTKAEHFTISFRDIDEAPIALTLANHLVTENTSGATIGTLTAEDPDFDDAGTTPAFEVDDGRFTVAGDVLKLKADLPLDHEVEPEVVVTVTARDVDDSTLSITRPFTIGVTDANDPPTQIRLEDVQLIENHSGEAVAELSAEDQDANDVHNFEVNDNRFEVVDGNRLWLKHGQCLGLATVALFVVAEDSGALQYAQELTLTVSPNPTPWHNRIQPLDVTNDGFIVPSDVLQIINDINADGSRRLGTVTDRHCSHYPDVSGDGFISPMDALLVINFLNRDGGAAAEGSDTSRLNNGAVLKAHLSGSMSILALPFSASREVSSIDLVRTIPAQGGFHQHSRGPDEGLEGHPKTSVDSSQTDSGMPLRQNDLYGAGREDRARNIEAYDAIFADWFSRNASELFGRDSLDFAALR